MKLTITHLKAPWPAGAKVGDVVELPDVPAWALGKCLPAADDAEVTAEAAIVANIAPADGAGAGALMQTADDGQLVSDGTGDALPAIEPPALAAAKAPKALKAPKA